MLKFSHYTLNFVIFSHSDCLCLFGSYNVAMPIAVTCEVCAKIFYVSPYRVAQNLVRFCSRACGYRGRQEIVIAALKAATTGKQAHNFAQVMIHCQTCHREFLVSPSRVGKTKFCSKSCIRKNSGVAEHKGYRWIRIKDEWVLEHRWIMEQYLGRKLAPHEHVHHRNNQRNDNRIENLKVVTRAEHTREHWIERHAQRGGRTSLICQNCQKQFFCEPSRKDRKKFCGKSCQRAYGRWTRT